jgi:catechol 2,3-dioxygenase-like lactoylglutathione lyase family enzyme
MCVEIFGPCLLVEDVPASAGFYIQHFGFQPRVELDWFTTLSHQDRPYELAFVRADHDTVPEGYRGRRTQGLVIGLLVPDAAAVDARLRTAGVRVVLPLRDEPFGQRHVMVADPNGVLVDVVQPIPADPGWLARHGPGQAGDPAEGPPPSPPSVDAAARPRP